MVAALIPVSMVFDGGVHGGNPGRGYGSFAVWGDGHAPHIERREYGVVMTNNEAEWETLIVALEWIKVVCERTQRAPIGFHLTVTGDSQLVIRQYIGQYFVHSPLLHPYYLRARAAGAAFGRVDMVWWARENSVRLLGH